jgi:DNA-binding PucR family transcriptional regulator
MGGSTGSTAGCVARHSEPLPPGRDAVTQEPAGLPPTEAAAERAPALPRWASAMADGVDLRSLAEVVVRRDLEAAFPSLRDHVEFGERLRASVAENLQALQDVLCGRTALNDVRLVEPFAFAAVQARLRVPQTSLQRSYRVGFTAMWEEWSERLVARAELDDVSRTEALEALRTLTTLLLAYQDHVASQVAESFARTDDALSRSRAHVRSGLVRQVLRDDAAPLSPSDLAILDYPLEATHVAVLLPTVAVGAAGQVLHGLRRASGARDALVHAVDLSSTVLWLAQPGAWRDDAVARLVDGLRALDVLASVSDPGVGLTGLRGTWGQVQEVESVRAAWGPAASPRLLRHADVSLEVLLMRDPSRAARFVSAELGPLGEPTEQAARLRETLEASYRWGSHVTAAEHLHLHEHTVRNRLLKAAELLGRPLQERRTELQVALRLARLLHRQDQ